MRFLTNRSFSLVAASFALAALLLVFISAQLARAEGLNSITYLPSVMTAGQEITVGTSSGAFGLAITTFTPESPLEAGDEIILTFPDDTSLANLNISDLRIIQAMDGAPENCQAGATAGTAAPASGGVNGTVVTLEIAAASLVRDDEGVCAEAGMGGVTVQFRSGGGGSIASNSIIHPEEASEATFAVSIERGGAEEMSGSIDFDFVADAPSELRFVDDIADHVYGETIPDITVHTTDQFGNATSTGEELEVELSVTAGSGDLVGTATTTTSTSGVAVFTGISVKGVDDDFLLGVEDENGLEGESNEFEIETRSITVTADNKSKTVGQGDPSLTYTISSGSLAFDDAFVGDLVRDAGESVGTYPITEGALAIDDGLGGVNYVVTFNPGTFTINAASSGGGSSGSYTSTDTRLTNLIAAGNISAAIALLQEYIARLVAAGAEAGTVPTSVSERDLETGMEGDDVRALQNLLMTQGYAIAAGATGFFGEQTRAALVAYQAANNISPAAGYFGTITRAFMKSSGLTGLWW